ncbi:MAG TPA: hypothetical protein VJ995_05495 [Geothermobacteraceae bacterium]|nr:hypothetical protein [Geothermobacteraceae bacterium]
MTGEEIRTAINLQLDNDTQFIKWWRKENDFVDYELIDKFLGRLEEGQTFSGFELLDLDQMLEVMQRWPSVRVTLEHRTHGDFIHWEHQEHGRATVEELPYSAASLMHIFDRETRGDTIQ